MRTLTVRIENKKTDDELLAIMDYFNEKTATKAIHKLIVTHKEYIDLIDKQNKELEQLRSRMESNNKTIRNYLSAKAALEKIKF